MRTTTVGRLLLDRALPPALRGRYDALDKKGVGKLFDDLAREHPAEYAEVAHKLVAVAKDVAYTTGGFSFGLKHMLPSQRAAALRQQVRTEVDRIQARRDLSDDAKDAAVVAVLGRYRKPIEDAVFEESEAEQNPLAHQVKNVGRGNKSSLKGLRAGDLAYDDHHGRTIPVPALTSYAEGLKPAEYFAASFGARKGVADTKFSTAQSGFLCLDEDTLVRMADGSAKAIKDIVVGDTVLGPGRPCRGMPVPARVTAVFDNGRRPCVRVRIRDDRWPEIAITATPYHRTAFRDGLLPLGAWKRELEAWLVVPATTPGLFAEATAPRQAAEFEEAGMRPTRDIEVDQPDHLFVLANGLVVANSKQMNQLAHRLVVTADDYDDGQDRSHIGLPVDVDDPDNEGALLARPAGGHPRDTVLTPKILASLRAAGLKRILVRSPLVGGPPQGGVLGKDVGVRERGAISPRGDYVGIAAAQALCLDEDTLVRMADGSAKAIKDIVVGDTVTGYCREDVALPGHYRRHFLRPVRVVAAYNNGERDCVAYSFYRNAHSRVVDVVCTPDHNVLAWDEYDYDGGPRVQPISGVERPIVAGSDSYRRRAATPVGLRRTRDIEVDHPDHLFLLANGLAVSNSEKMTQGMLSSKHCLSEDTLVRMADGSARAIQDIVVGDTVLGSDLAGKTAPARVTAVFDNGPRPCSRYIAGDAAVVCTADHRFLAPCPGSGRLVAMPLRQCDWVRTVSGEEPPVNLVEDAGLVLTRDIEVDHPDHLFVLANGLIVSNSGGVSGAGGAPSGFRWIDALLQIPKTFPYGATHAQRDGKIGSISDAPQGGRYVLIDGEKHYVPAGMGLKVATGDVVEAGDVLSDGIPNPAEVVRHKGIGAGRAYLVTAVQRAFRDSGLSAHRRNVELLARGSIDHVRLTDELGEHVPDDVVPYSVLERAWEPRPGARDVAPRQAVGKYLERPVLHHTVGTAVRPSMLADFDEFGVDRLHVHDDPPPFVPEMVRGMAATSHDLDWMTRHLGSNLQKATLEAAHRGRTSDTAGTSYVPAVAERVHFGRAGPTRGWDPRELGRSPRDADNDNIVYEGTPYEQPARRRLDDDDDDSD